VRDDGLRIVQSFGVVLVIAIAYAVPASIRQSKKSRRRLEEWEDRKRGNSEE
jgi:hypothetical protein